MAMNGVGCRATARMGVSLNTFYVT
ncbi:IS1-like element transposase [Serratia ureilytica]